MKYGICQWCGKEGWLQRWFILWVCEGGCEEEEAEEEDNEN